MVRTKTKGAKNELAGDASDFSGDDLGRGHDVGAGAMKLSEFMLMAEKYVSDPDTLKIITYAYKAGVISQRNKTMPSIKRADVDWAGMNGLEAWKTIDRLGWDEPTIQYMMEQWLDANRDNETAHQMALDFKSWIQVQNYKPQGAQNET